MITRRCNDRNKREINAREMRQKVRGYDRKKE
jgi:hypothetical protein